MIFFTSLAQYLVYPYCYFQLTEDEGGVCNMVEGNNPGLCVSQISLKRDFFVTDYVEAGYVTQRDQSGPPSEKILLVCTKTQKQKHVVAK